MLLLKQLGFSSSTQVTYVDVSVPALEYQQYLIDHWDGNLNDYYVLVEKYQEQHPEYRYAWRSWRSWTDEISDFLQQVKMTVDEFQTLWQQYRQLTHYFLNLDLLDNTDLLVSHVANQTVYIWLSNTYDMQWTRFMHGSQHTRQKLKALISNLQTVNCQGFVETAGEFYRLN